MGWGAYLEGDMLQRRWESQEQLLHINILEMREVAKALQGFPFPPGASVLVSSDKSTVVSYINREGGTPHSPSGKKQSLFFNWSLICRSPSEQLTSPRK